MRSTKPLAALFTRVATTDNTLASRSVGPLPQAVANLAGSWEGTLYLTDADIGIRFALVQGGTADDPAAVGQLAFAGGEEAPAAVQLLEASATTYVALVGPYIDPVTAMETVTVLEGRVTGDRLYGTYRARAVSGGHAIEGRFVAVRSQRAAA